MYVNDFQRSFYLNKAVLQLVFYKETPFQNKQRLEQVKNVNQQLWTDFSSFWYQMATINHPHTVHQGAEVVDFDTCTAYGS